MKTAVATIMVLCALGILLSLGFWQISRGQEKAAVLDRLTEHSTSYTPLHQISSPVTAVDYTQVELTGRWQADKQFLLANRSYKNVVGFEILTPYEMASGQWLIVNRGWVGPNAPEASYELVDSSEGPKGVLYQPQKGYAIGASILPQTTWPQTSLYLDFEAFSDVAGLEFMPLVLVLDADSKNAQTRIWQAVNSGPERHYGYAVQWFGLALVLVVFAVIWLRRARISSTPS